MFSSFDLVAGGAPKGSVFNDGVGTMALGNARNGPNPPNYFDASTPLQGRSFALSSIQTERGVKRPYLSGDLEGEMPNWGVGTKRARRGDPNVVGFTSNETFAEFGSSVRIGSAEDIARSFGFSTNMMNRNVRSTMGFLSNPTIPGNETYLKTLTDYETPGEYDLVIMRNQFNFERQRLVPNPAAGFFVDMTLRIGFTLAGFNRYLLSLQPEWDKDAQGNQITSKQYLEDMGRYRERRWKTPMGSKAALEMFEQGVWYEPMDIWRHFHLGGVIDSETFAGGTSSVTTHEYGMENRRNGSYDVKVNLVQMGRAQCLGLIPPQKPAGTRIGLITKRVPRASYYMIDTLKGRSEEEIMHASLLGADPTTFDKKSGRKTIKRTNYPWQVIPWTDDKKTYPDADDLAYIDPFGQVRYGEFLYLGVVNKENNLDRECNPYELATNLSLARTHKPTDMFLTLGR